jgi:5'-nucleotidase
MHILVDMDGVLADFEGHFLALWREAHPDEPYIPPEERTSFWLVEQYPEELHQRMWDIMLAPGFFAEIPPVPGGLEAVGEMLTLGHEVHICSSPLLGNPTCASDKYAWIERHLDRDWAARLILSSDKTIVEGDVLIDDRPDPEAGGARTPTWTHIVFDHPYNRSVPEKPRLDWGNWKEILFSGEFGN